MDIQQSQALGPLRAGYKKFVDCVRSTSEAGFLSPIDGWAPRDIVAHLVGWNRALLQASKSILSGETPTYYGDAVNDYRNINAAFVARYSAVSREGLLKELASSMTEFETFVESLPLAELIADHGVTHYSGEPATVARIIRSLTCEYDHHGAQIAGSPEIH